MKMDLFDFSDYCLDRMNKGVLDAEDDCRISSYFAQGCCYITGRPLREGQRELHHRNRKFYGGTDTAENTMMLDQKVHRLVHCGNPYRARDLMRELALTDEQLRLVNQLRLEAHMPLLKRKSKATHPAA